MYSLILSGLASMRELKECYSLDEALKLYALHRMGTDIERCRAEERREATRRSSRGRR